MNTVWDDEDLIMAFVDEVEADQHEWTYTFVDWRNLLDPQHLYLIEVDEDGYPVEGEPAREEKAQVAFEILQEQYGLDPVLLEVAAALYDGTDIGYFSLEIALRYVAYQCYEMARVAVRA